MGENEPFPRMWKLRCGERGFVNTLVSGYQFWNAWNLNSGWNTMEGRRRNGENNRVPMRRWVLPVPVLGPVAWGGRRGGLSGPRVWDNRLRMGFERR